MIASIHTWLGDAILWIAGVHAAAALDQLRAIFEARVELTPGIGDRVALA